MIEQEQNASTASRAGKLLTIVGYLPATFWPLLVMLLFTQFSGGSEVLDSVLWTLSVQEVPFEIRVGTLFIAAAMISLMLEMVKVTWLTKMSDAVVDFILSFIVAAIHLAVFFALPGYANETLFYMTLVAIIDVFAGIVIASRVGQLLRHLRGLSAARRMMRR